MKKFIFILFFTTVAFSQELPKLSEEGFTPIVVNVEAKTSIDLYLKTKDWIQTYYKNPNEVLKADIKNEMIRIEGFAVGGFQTKGLGQTSYLDYHYTIEIEFKEGKYRFNYIIGQFYAGSQKAAYSYKYFFKKDGSIRKTQQLPYDSINETANNTSFSLFNYITGKTNSEKKSW